MHKPRKRFGQNFLQDNNIIFKIVQAIHPKPDDQLLEIGPGYGAITRELLNITKAINVVELDRDVIPYLKMNCENLGSLNIHQGDILKYNFAEHFAEPTQLRVIGNLPYNISSPLIFHLLAQQAWIKDMHFMLQKEVVQRMVAEPGSKTYGRLSVMVQYHCQASMLFSIGPEAFKPAPKVDSAIIRLIPRLKKAIPVHNQTLFAEVVRQAFNHRRKTLQKSLKSLCNLKLFAEVGIDPQSRPEQISVDDFCQLVNGINDQSQRQ